MEIIKQGDLERLRKTKEFNCPACGCIFRADQNEYKHSWGGYNEEYYTCECPTCKRLVYLEVK